MILGMSAGVFVHVILSLIGILAGAIVLFGMIRGSRLDGLTALFLTTTALTSVTGFFLPAGKILPSHIIAVLSLIALALAFYARYSRKLSGGWNRTYVVTATIALYFNVFVLIAQSFMKVPALKALAPTQSEPPFLVAQLANLVLFVVLGVVAVKGFRNA